MIPLTESEKIVLNSVSASLGVPPEWLFNLIKFESGWNPQIKNKLSSARGLIQFIDRTAAQFGYRDSLDLVSKLPDRVSQLRGAVLPYLEQFKPFPTEQSLYMAVFYPSFRYVSPDTLFPDTVQKVNPGIKRVSDYVSKVQGKLAKFIAPGLGMIFFWVQVLI